MPSPHAPELGHCWLWDGDHTKAGYGFLRHTHERGEYAHRLAWSLAHSEEIPAGHCIMHRCDNPGCVRPDHLALGTDMLNALDCSLKGRRPSKLSAESVAEIRNLWSVGAATQAALAKRFGVSRRLINGVVRRAVWTHVP